MGLSDIIQAGGKINVEVKGLFPRHGTGDGGGNASIDTVATFAAIGNSTEKRSIIVLADETEYASPKVLYMHDGTTLHKIAILYP
ncbi:hypothetical protein ACX0G7_09690 [Flavitalea antarctica]